MSKKIMLLQDRLGCSDEIFSLVKESLLDEPLFQQTYGDDLTRRPDFSIFDPRQKSKFNYTVVSLKEKVAKVDELQNKTFAEYYNLDSEQVDYLKKHHSLATAKKIWGESLEEKADILAYLKIKRTDFEGINRMCNALTKDEIASSQTLMKRLDCSNEIIIAFRESLDDNSHIKMELAKFYGDDFLQPRLKPLRRDESSTSVSSYISTTLAPKVDIAKSIEGKTLGEYLGLSEDEVKEYICNSFDASRFLRDIWGNNLDQPANINGYFKIGARNFNNSLKRIRNYFNQREEKSKLTLTEKYKWSDGVLKAYIKSLDASSSLFILLTRVYGNDLQSIPSYDGLSQKDANTARNYFRNKYKKISLAQELENKTLQEYLKMSDNTYDNFIKGITPKYLEELQSIWGSNFKEETNLVNYYKNSFRRIIFIITSGKKYSLNDFYIEEKIPEQRVEEPVEPDVLLSIPCASFDAPIFKAAVEVMPIEYRLVLSLYLGIYDGNAYPLSSLCKIFNQSEEVINETLNTGISFLKRIISSYNKVYNDEFPKEISSDDILRKK